MGNLLIYGVVRDYRTRFFVYKNAFADQRKALIQWEGVLTLYFM